MTKYILQTREKGYSACFVIALLNARIYFNKPYLKSLNDPRWEEMIDRYRCRYGSCLELQLVRDDLNVMAEQIDRNEIPDNLPAQITSFTKVGFHSSLVTNCKGDNWTIVNYNGSRGKLITTINKNHIKFLKRGHSSDRHWRISLKDA